MGCSCIPGVPESLTREGKEMGVSAPHLDYNTGEVLIHVLETVISHENPYLSFWGGLVP